MDKYVMVRYDEDTGNCDVMEPQEVIAQEWSTKAEVKLPKGPRKVVFTNPISLTVHDDVNPIGKAREEGYDNGFEFGRNEVWNIVHDLMTSPDFGADFVAFGGWNSPIDIFNDTYEHVFNIVQKWRGRPKCFDIVKVCFDDGVEEEAIITRVDGDEVDLLCRGGRTTYRNIADVTNTGKTLEYGLLKWVKGE